MKKFTVHILSTKKETTVEIEANTEKEIESKVASYSSGEKNIEGLKVINEKIESGLHMQIEEIEDKEIEKIYGGELVYIHKIVSFQITANTEQEAKRKIYEYDSGARKIAGLKVTKTEARPRRQIHAGEVEETAK